MKSDNTDNQKGSSYGAKPYGKKPFSPKPYGEKKYSGKPYGKEQKYGKKPAGTDSSDRTYAKKSYTSHPDGYRSKPYAKKPYEDRRPVPVTPVNIPETEKKPEAPQETENLYVIGRNAVMELLKSGRNIDKLYVKKGERGGSLNVIVAESLNRGIPLAEVDGDKLDYMAAGVAHQGVIASAPAKDYCQVEDILKAAAEKNEKPLILIADGIEDPYNLGAVIRVAECAGVHGIILGKHRAVGLTGAVSKASAGALEHMLIARVSNLAQNVDKLKEAGIWIYVAEAGGVSYYECDMNAPAAIILGSEGFGVSRLLLDKCDYRVSIPMYGNVNSLNVSTAAAVIVNEAARQHRNSQK